MSQIDSIIEAAASPQEQNVQDALHGLGFYVRRKSIGPGHDAIFVGSGDPPHHSMWDLKLCELKHLDETQVEIMVEKSMESLRLMPSFTGDAVKTLRHVLSAWRSFLTASRKLSWQKGYFAVTGTADDGSTYEVQIGTTSSNRHTSTFIPSAPWDAVLPSMTCENMGVLIQAVFGAWDRFLRLHVK